VDRELVALGSRHDDHLEEVARVIRPDDEPTVGIFASIFDDQSMIDGVKNILVGDIVLSRRVVNLYELSVLRKERQAATRVRRPHWASRVEAHPDGRRLACAATSRVTSFWPTRRPRWAQSPENTLKH
jgi:hypothetical protein